MPDISTMPAACRYMGTVTGHIYAHIDAAAEPVELLSTHPEGCLRPLNLETAIPVTVPCNGKQLPWSKYQAFSRLKTRCNQFRIFRLQCAQSGA